MPAAQQPSMNNPDPAFIATPISGALAAALTIASAVPTINKRLGRIGEVESQIGHLPKLVRVLYVAIQRFYKWALLVITFVGVVMVVAYIFASMLTHPFFAFLRENGIVLIVLWLVLGAAMYTNAVSRFAIWMTRLLTSLLISHKYT